MSLGEPAPRQAVTRSGQCAREKAVIVHPKFLHTLPQRSSLAVPATIHLLPLHVLSLVASKLDNAKDVCRFEQICLTAR